MSQRSALVLGASGLVGQELLKMLLSNSLYNHVTVCVRKKLPIEHTKLRQLEIDFSELDKHEECFAVDDVYCCLGTTMKKAKTKAKFIKVDYEFPLKAAKCAEKYRCKNFLTITAIGADLRSPFFYSKVKGQVEEDIASLYIRSTHFFRPSLLLGKRQEFRLFEKIGGYTLKSCSFCLVGKWRKYRPIKAYNVAKSMMKAALEDKCGVHVHESQDIYTGECYYSFTNGKRVLSK
ncbi:NAD-dependent epimerase/dehydratase family protein [Priestia sp. AB]|uniref:NAD-dependent epimerase/dehydratase family protein n=1 Tax=Priestia sp. AB TaxID=3020890 RepID=UPI00232C117C|nr:NAD(P)H-binding protein [Priestia sp. AB]MDC0702506.1 NAD-dependent epimerase/dehydratase family protein [Priestia sp. AB]